MVKKIDIICPVCGRKLLGRADSNATGTVYLWCKVDKKEIAVRLGAVRLGKDA